MAYQSGTSEEYLGRAIKEYGHREDVVIATKYTPKSDDSIDSRTYLTECLNNSLRRLQTDYIDLYIMHMWDYQTPIEDTLEILNDFIKEGKIKEIGISNCFAYQLATANVTHNHPEGIKGAEATKLKHVDTAVLATELELSEDEKQYLEEPYQPHALVGVMATNTK